MRLVCSLVVLALGLAQADTINIVVIPALAPNAYGSPSFAGWQANAVYALTHGLTSYGNPNSPTYYEAGSVYNSAQVVVTGFPSWMGQVDPGPGFTAEYGNRMHFGLRVDGGGSQFSISQLAFSATSTDPFNALAFAYPDGYSYSLGSQGVLAGADGLLWTDDDTYVVSGPSTQLVDGLVRGGSGNSFAAYCPGCTLAQQQAALNDVASYPGTPFDFTGTYFLKGASGEVLASGSGTFQINPTPEPGTLLLFGCGIAGICCYKARQRLAKQGR